MTQQKMPDVVELTQQLVRMETISANYKETPILEFLASLLEGVGFQCSYSYYDPENPERASLVAQSNPADDAPALCFGGHIDTVPFGNAPWADEPLAALIKDGKLYGRGSADMKGGLAAYVCAAANMVDKLNGRNLILHMYGGEELGLLGSAFLARDEPEKMGKVGAVIVAEPTALDTQFGNKGVTWYQFETKGVTAHASMPDKGDNALVKLLPTACRLIEYQPQASHPYLGKSTMVLSVMQSGLNANSVPDSALFKADVRTVVGQDSGALLEEFRAMADPGVSVNIVADTAPLWSEPDSPWCRRVREIVAKVTGQTPGTNSAIFGTDASSLRIALKDEPMIILGPGAQGMAHMTDEYVLVDELHKAQSIYEAIIADWYGI